MPQVEWLREKSKDIPIRLVFESALELMSTTQLGGFKVAKRLLAGVPLIHCARACLLKAQLATVGGRVGLAVVQACIILPCS